MTDVRFLDSCKSYVKQYTTDHLDKSDDFNDFDVYVVWYCKTIQNWKALLSTTLRDGMYYEVTYDGVNKVFYLDVYKKRDTEVIIDDN